MATTASQRQDPKTLIDQFPVLQVFPNENIDLKARDMPTAAAAGTIIVGMSQRFRQAPFTAFRRPAVFFAQQ
jgi:hypothetical protein